MHYNESAQVWHCCASGPIAYVIGMDTCQCVVCHKWYTHNEGPTEPLKVDGPETDQGADYFEPPMASGAPVRKKPVRPRKVA